MDTSGAYDKFRMGGFHEELSSVYLNENGEITACLLISDQGQTEGFTVEYANSEGCADKTGLMQLFKYASDKLLNYYTSDAISGYALAINDVAGSIIKKAFRHARVIDRCSVYVRLMGEEE